jgi:hypothetical protein
MVAPHVTTVVNRFRFNMLGNIAPVKFLKCNISGNLVIYVTHKAHQTFTRACKPVFLSFAARENVLVQFLVLRKIFFKLFYFEESYINAFLYASQQGYAL